MSDEPNKRRTRAWIWWTLFVVFVLYPLSMGPALAITEAAGPGSATTVFFFLYLPLYSLAEVPGFGPAFGWYVSLWVKR
ncbi:MAG TPA: hypothetical protein VGP76_03340 [Planctomycetaceae bacterium]|jgi:hypothetical protein|nr:hypothetical protein [Planctomycetaceae bacterium]